MEQSFERRHYLATYSMVAVIFLSVLVRGLTRTETGADRRLLFILLSVYLLLAALEPFISYRRVAFLHFYIPVQCAIAVSMLFALPDFDYYVMLMLPLPGLIYWKLKPKAALAWFAFIVACTLLSLMAVFGILEGISYAMAYLVAMVILVAFGQRARDAEQAQLRSQKLLEELQEANRRLKNYASQVEELTAANERNRLARELHDSVTQTIFSMTLTAQAAMILLERSPEKVPAQLAHLQELAQSALAEMRSLIQQLRPRPVAEIGLVPALRRHLADRQIQDGLEVELDVRGERRLPAETEEALFRVIQEALNNIVKHAGVKQARVTLSLESSPVWFEIEDHGAGFDPSSAALRPGHMGLSSMSERVQNLGATLTIVSQPGRGTKIRVDHLKIEENEHVAG